METTDKSLLKFAEDTLFSAFSKLARVNVMTGEFQFIKRDSDFMDDQHADSPDIFTYIRRQVMDGTVLPDHAEEYLKFSRPDYVRKRVFSGERRSVHSYRRKVGDVVKWMTFNIISAEDCSPQNPYALFAWREADSDTTTMFDAVSVLSGLYYKILRINLTTDTYESVKVMDEGFETPDTISGWFRAFAEKGNVHPDDVDAYLEFTDINRLRAVFKEDTARRTIRYRRRSVHGFRWAQMYLFPSVEYTENNQLLTLYVRDVHEEHITELRDREKLVELYNRDALTLLYNRHKYNEDLTYVSRSNFKRMSVAYIDLNGLHEVNNTLGHEAGDNMLCTVADALKKYYPDERCYRIGGDEFVVISVRLSENTVGRIMQEVKKDLLNDQYAISAGIASGLPEEKERILGEAELKMREDKAAYYRSHGDRRKRRQMNDELEKLLSDKRDEEYFLKVISKRFAGVYFVDMDDESVRHIYMPDYFGTLLEQTDYNYIAALKLYVQRYVKAEYAPKFEELMNFDQLKKQLSERGSISVSYEKVNGKRLHIYILRQDERPEVNESVWIFEEES